MQNDPVANADNITYLQECMLLYMKLKNVDQSLIFRPPLKTPPKHMYQDFIQNGKMEIRNYLYFNEIYFNFDSNKTRNLSESIKSSSFYKNLNKVKNNQPLDYYYDTTLNNLMHIYSDKIKNKSFAVIGSQTPWIEAIAYDIGALPITSFDYTHKKYNITFLEWIHMSDYLNNAVENRSFELYDNIASYSWIEHIGLGRFGDPLSPYGDVDTVKQIHCMLKPGGLFFLGLPTSDDDSSYIDFNAHRVYGTDRLSLLFKDWDLLYRESSDNFIDTIFVLRKK